MTLDDIDSQTLIIELTERLEISNVADVHREVLLALLTRINIELGE